MIRDCKKAAWQELKKEGVIFYSAVYFIFAKLFTELTEELNFVFSIRYYSVTNVIVMSLVNFVLFTAAVAFAYMIMNHKLKVKRFFSFLAPKHFKFNLFAFIILIVPHAVLCIISEYFKFKEYMAAELAFTVGALVLQGLIKLMPFFKAMNPYSSCGEIIRKTVKFIISHLFKFIMFNLSFIPWIFANAFIIYLFDRKLGLDVVSLIFSTIISIVYFAYYILSFKHFVKSFE